MYVLFFLFKRNKLHLIDHINTPLFFVLDDVYYNRLLTNSDVYERRLHLIANMFVCFLLFLFICEK